MPASEAVRREAAAAIGRLEAAGADVKWAEPSNLHWTLHFFGETPRERVPGIEAVMKAAAGGSAPFELELGEAGAFPSKRAPRVLWLGLGSGEDALGALATDLRKRLADKGFEVEARPFRAHLTLGRVRGLKRVQALGRALEDVRVRASMRGERLELVRSWLGPTGPRYETILSIELGER